MWSTAIMKPLISSMCCDAGLTWDGAGYYRQQCLDCGYVYDLGISFCRGSFSLDYTVVNQYGGLCRECGRIYARSVGYNQYGRRPGVLMPHEASLPLPRRVQMWVTDSALL